MMKWLISLVCCFGGKSHGRLGLSRIAKKTENSLFTKCLGRLQPVETFNQHETSAIRPYQDRRLLALLEDARGDFVYALLIKGGAPLDWHVDVCDCEGLALHHTGFTSISVIHLALSFSNAFAQSHWRSARQHPFRDDNRAVQSDEQIHQKSVAPSS